MSDELFVLELPRFLCGECTGVMVMDHRSYETDKASGHEVIARLVLFCVNSQCKRSGERVEVNFSTLKRAVKPYGPNRNKGGAGTTEATDRGPAKDSGGN